MGNKIKAAAIGGGVIFLLALLTSFLQLPFVRLLCCMWAIGGGALAVYIYNRSSPAAARGGDGAILGALAGLIGGIPAVIPVLRAMNNPAMQAQLEDRIREAGYSSGMPVSMSALLLMVGAVFVLTTSALATIGGLIGASLFGKNAKGGGNATTPTQPPPVPPPDFSHPS